MDPASFTVNIAAFQLSCIATGACGDSGGTGTSSPIPFLKRFQVASIHSHSRDSGAREEGHG